jgi:hypothetical protein
MNASEQAKQEFNAIIGWMITETGVALRTQFHSTATNPDSSLPSRQFNSDFSPPSGRTQRFENISVSRTNVLAADQANKIFEHRNYPHKRTQS